ncbi:MAG: serine hydrolase [Planctomyces sp.]|nr:serine hydrolase [Planctomyces sp.]
MRFQSRRRALMTIGAAASCSVLGLPIPARGAARRLDGPFDRLVKSEGFTDDGPGLAVLVQQQGQPAYMRCVGLATLEDRRPVTPQTMFELASVTKSITGTAVLILHEQRKLNVSDDVRKHIPELPKYDAKHPIRIRDLAQQVSGLASYMDLEDVPSKTPDCWVNADYVGEFARQNVPLSFPTGEKYEYCNTNYMLLAVVIERVSGKSYGAFLREAIFEPAGMKTAFVNEGPGSVPDANGRVDAIGYVRADSQWQAQWGTPPARNETLLTCGDGAVWCSLEDMAAWDVALHSGKLLRSETAKMAIAPSRTRDGNQNAYGFGWSLYYNGPGQLAGFGHSGGWGGFGTYYYFDIATRRTMVFLGNGRALDLDKFWYSLTALVDMHGLG